MLILKTREVVNMDIKINDPINYGGTADPNRLIIPVFVEIPKNVLKFAGLRAVLVSFLFRTDEWNYYRSIAINCPVQVNKLEDIEKSWTEKGFEVIKNY